MSIRRRRTKAEVAALVVAYQEGHYLPQNRQERFWLEQRVLAQRNRDPVD